MNISDKTEDVHSSDNNTKEGQADLQIILQMYQMAHNELLVRIQQREQYYICMFAAFSAILVGLFTTSSSLLTVQKWVCVLGVLLLLVLTLRFLNSYRIFGAIVDHMLTLEDVLSCHIKCDAAKTEMWQKKISNSKPYHRCLSFAEAVSMFLICDVIAIIATVRLFYMG